MTFDLDPNNSNMKNYLIDQSARITEIITHAGKFKENYEVLVGNIISSMNDSLKRYVKSARKSILCDVYDSTVEKIDWNAFRARFNNDVSNKTSMKASELKPIGSDLKQYTIEEYDTEILGNMIMNLEENQKSMKKFTKFQNEAVDALSDLNTNLDAFESGLCAWRTKNIQIMNENIENLYKLHVNYAKNVLNNKNYIPEDIIVNNEKIIKMEKSQSVFIKNASKVLLGL